MTGPRAHVIEASLHEAAAQEVRAVTLMAYSRAWREACHLLVGELVVLTTDGGDKIEPSRAQQDWELGSLDVNLQVPNRAESHKDVVQRDGIDLVTREYRSRRSGHRSFRRARSFRGREDN